MFSHSVTTSSDDDFSVGYEQFLAMEYPFEYRPAGGH
jgi:hypothetical protein